MEIVSPIASVVFQFAAEALLVRRFVPGSFASCTVMFAKIFLIIVSTM